MVWRAMQSDRPNVIPRVHCHCHIECSGVSETPAPQCTSLSSNFVSLGPEPTCTYITRHLLTLKKERLFSIQASRHPGIHAPTAQASLSAWGLDATSYLQSHILPTYPFVLILIDHRLFRRISRLLKLHARRTRQPMQRCTVLSLSAKKTFPPPSPYACSNPGPPHTADISPSSQPREYRSHTYRHTCSSIPPSRSRSKTLPETTAYPAEASTSIDPAFAGFSS